MLNAVLREEFATTSKSGLEVLLQYGKVYVERLVIEDCECGFACTRQDTGMRLVLSSSPVLVVWRNCLDGPFNTIISAQSTKQGKFLSYCLYILVEKTGLLIPHILLNTAHCQLRTPSYFTCPYTLVETEY